jgi:hypothetical protein
MPALYTRGDGDGPRPVVVYCNGLDSCKELLYWSRLPEAWPGAAFPPSASTSRQRRGPAFAGLPVDPHSENWASKAVDWLESSPMSTPSASA